MYRWLEALEQPREVPGGAILRPAYLHQEESAVGIRYNRNGLINHLQEILAVCGCNDCVKQRKSRIPHFKNIEEEAAFWDSYDSAAFEDEFVEVDDVQFVKAAPKKALTVRLEEPTLRDLRRIAKEKGIDPSILARMWIVERLRASAGE